MINDKQVSTFENTSIPKSPLLTDRSNTDVTTNFGYSVKIEKKILQENSHLYYNMTLKDNILKNMHKKWSKID
jgi:hypothetical protein